MQQHQLPSQRLSKKRIGRGGKRGTTSGRGTKGQSARSGGRRRPGFEGGRTSLAMLTPKLRGSGSGMGSSSNRKIRTVRIDRILSHIEDGAVITPDILVSSGVLRAEPSRYGLSVKIVGAKDFVLTKKIVVENCAVTKQLEAQIQKAGGEVRSTEL